jgi:NADH:ubiquinone oxidoreductase subunit F (NADH-binding)
VTQSGRPLAVGTGRLLGKQPHAREPLVEYQTFGGYDLGRVRGRALIDRVESVNLRGRGGAGFPAGVKLRAVADRPGPRVAVANGEEGEPASVKDRWLLRHRPHLVLDGLLLASEAIGADDAIVYLSDEQSQRSVEYALAERPAPVRVVRVEPAYIAGEESSVVRALAGGPAKPTDKPPRPFELGTLVSNVETLANLPSIAAGAEPDTTLMTFSGAIAAPGVHEVLLGVPLREMVELDTEPRGFLMGGFFAGLLGPRALDIPLDHDALRAEGSGLGCGAVVVLDSCPVAAAAELMDYFARSNAQQCGACIRGTAAMAGVLRALALGETDDAGLQRLRGWSVSLRGRGACGTLDGAANLAGTLLREFPSLVDEHRETPCDDCRAALETDPGGGTRFAFAI